MKLQLVLISLVITACSKSNQGPNSGLPYTDTSTKVEVNCPAQTATTEVLFAFGQSNSANHDVHSFSNTDARIINYFEGHCYIASDPMLGATGLSGSVWIPTAQGILASGQVDTVIIATAGIGGSAVARWATGDLVSHYEERLSDVASSYTVTKFLWHQGEADGQQGTSTSDYEASISQVIQKAQATVPSAKFFVSIVSLCGSPVTHSNITDAQRSIINGSSILQGPDSDTIPVSMRSPADNCHMAESGQNALAQLWITAIGY